MPPSFAGASQSPTHNIALPHPAPFDFSAVYAQQPAHIKFAKADDEFPAWLSEVTREKPDIREMSREEDGKRFDKLKRKLEIKVTNQVKDF